MGGNMTEAAVIFPHQLFLDNPCLKKNRVTGKPISVSPLTWSHAAYLTTTQRLLRRLAERRSLPGFRERQEDWVGRLYNKTCDVIHGICEI